MREPIRCGRTARRFGLALAAVLVLAAGRPARAEQQPKAAPNAVPAVSRAAAPEARCPTTIGVDESLSSPPSGWTANRRKPGNRLVGVTFFDGPPADEASLVYDETKTDGDEWVATWRFTPNPAGFWIACRYEDTKIELARKLPETVTVCRVRYDKRIVTDPRHDDVRRIDCE